MKRHSPRAYWTAAVLTAAILVLAWTQRHLFRDVASPVAGGTLPSGPSTALERVATVDKSLRALEDAERLAPRDRWDPDYLVGQLGSDPQVLFDWVSSSTSWIPYHGILRGATGVLMDRQGNSLDRAILLATLLEKAGHTVRLAHRQLPAAEAIRRISDMPVVPGSVLGIEESRRLSADEIREAASRYELNPREILETVEAQNQAAIRLVSELDARVAQQTTRLLQAIPRPDPAHEWNQRLEDAIDARQDHWWVQHYSAGNWTNYDVDDREPGPQPDLQFDRALRLDELVDAGLHHEIAVRIMAEQWSGGTVSERTVMEHSLRPAEMTGQPVVLQFLPHSALEPNVPQVSEVDIATQEQRGWRVFLSIGPQVVADGVIERRVTGGGSFGGIGSAIATLGGTEDRELSAVWIEYEFRMPRQPQQVIKRTVLDLIGPAARSGLTPPTLVLDDSKQLERALALTTRTELLPIVCRLSREYVAHLLSENLIRNRNLLRYAAQNFGALPGSTMSELIDDAEPPVTSLYSLALARLDWAGNFQHVFINEPGLLTSHTRLAQDGDRKLVQSATDIVANPIGVSLGIRDAFAMRVAHGVLDTNAETYLQTGPIRFGNAADAFALPQPWETLTAADGVTDLQLSEDVRQRIRQDLLAGHVVVAPKSPVSLAPRSFSGWWRIDPLSGQTLGMGANGWGTAMNETTADSGRKLQGASALRQAGARFFKVFNVTTGFCVVTEAVPNVETKGLVLGLKALIVENPNQCAYQGLFFGALATVPLVILTVNPRLCAMAEAEGGLAGSASAGEAAAVPGGRSPAAQSVAVPGKSPNAQSVVVPGKSPQANTFGSSRSRATGPCGQVAARSLAEIEADLVAARSDMQAASNKINSLESEFQRSLEEAQARRLPDPSQPPGYRDALRDKINAWERVSRLESEYVQSGGTFDAQYQPAGPFKDLDLPMPPPRSGAGTGMNTTQDMGVTQPDMGKTLPPRGTTVVGLGGLSGVD